MAKAEAARIGGALGTALLAIILQRTIAAGLPASTGASRRSPRCRNNSWRPQRQRSPAPSTAASGSAIRLIAAALSSSAADVRGTMVSPGDLFALDLTAYWSWSIHEQEQVGGSWLRQLAGQRRRARSSPTCNAGTCTLKVGWSPRRLHRLELAEQHRGIAPPADEQGRLSHAGRPDLGVLVPVAVLVAVDAQRPLEPGAGVRPGVLVQVLLAEPARQLLGLRHAVQHTPGRSWVFEQARDQVGQGVTRKGVQEAAHGPAGVGVELRLGDAQRIGRGGATWDELPQHLAGGAGGRGRYVTLSATNPATRCGNSSAHASHVCTRM